MQACLGTVCLTIAHALFAEILASRLGAIIEAILTAITILASAYWHKIMQFTHAHLLNKRKSSIFSCLFNISCSKAKTSNKWEKRVGYRAKMMHLFRIKHSIN